MTLSLLLIRPRLRGNGLQDRGSFAFFATASEAALTEDLTTDCRRVRLQVLSALALRKMRALTPRVRRLPRGGRHHRGRDLTNPLVITR